MSETSILINLSQCRYFHRGFYFTQLSDQGFRFISFMGSTEILQVAGQIVVTAQMEVKNFDFSSSAPLRLARSRWISDEEVSECFKCAIKFSAIRRKHHCRQCGRIFCSQCCHEKMWLPHLAYTSEQRVCALCAEFVMLLNKVQSAQQSDKVEAAISLSEMSKDAKVLPLFLEMGGVIALIRLLCEKDSQIVNVVLKSLSGLSSQPHLQWHLVNAGLLQAINRLLSNCSFPEDSDLAVEAMNLLTNICSADVLKLTVVSGDVLDVVFSLCNVHSSGNVNVAALWCINVMSTCELVCDAIVDNAKQNTLAKLLSMTSSPVEQVQVVAFKILSHISVSSVRNRRRLVEEELYRGSSLADILSGRMFVRGDLLPSVVCLVANVAADEALQGALSSHLLALCRLLETASCVDISLLRQIARSLANFAQFSCNADVLLNHFSAVCSKLIRSSDRQAQSYACQTTLALIGLRTEACISILLSSGCVAEFLRFLGSDSEAVSRLQKHFASRLPSILLQ